MLKMLQLKHPYRNQNVALIKLSETTTIYTLYIEDIYLYKYLWLIGIKFSSWQSSHPFISYHLQLWSRFKQGEREKEREREINYLIKILAGIEPDRLACSIDSKVKQREMDRERCKDTDKLRQTDIGKLQGSQEYFLSPIRPIFLHTFATSFELPSNISTIHKILLSLIIYPIYFPSYFFLSLCLLYQIYLSLSLPMGSHKKSFQWPGH